MAELIVVGFKKDMYRASETLNIQNMNSWMVDLRDAVTVYRDYKGKLRVDQSYRMTTGEGAAWGGLAGGLIGAILAAPFTAGVSAAAAAGALAAGSMSGVALGASFGATDAESWKEDFGISEDFVERVGSMIQPGDSAIFALVRTLDPNLVADAFRGQGATILRTTLNDTQRAGVEASLYWGPVMAAATQASTGTLKAFEDRIKAQVAESKSKLDQLEAKAKENKAGAEAATFNHLKTTKQDIDRRLQDLKATHDAHVARAKSEIEADVAKFKASIEDLGARFKNSKE